MIGEVKNMLRSKFKKAYLYIFCCGNKDKMDREVSKQAMKDAQDILWEELEEQFQKIRIAFKKGLITLNDISINKSAHYLDVKRYIDNVKDKTQVEQPERSKNRIRKRKYKSRQVADLDSIRLATSVNDFFNDTAAHFNRQWNSTASKHAKVKNSYNHTLQDAVYEESKEFVDDNITSAVVFSSPKLQTKSRHKDFETTKMMKSSCQLLKNTELIDNRNNLVKNSSVRDENKIFHANQETQMVKLERMKTQLDKPNKLNIPQMSEKLPSKEIVQSQSIAMSGENPGDNSILEYQESASDDESEVNMIAFNQEIQKEKRKNRPANRYKLRKNTEVVEYKTGSRNKGKSKNKSHRTESEKERMEASIDLNAMYGEQTFGVERFSPRDNENKIFESPVERLFTKRKQIP